MKFKFSGTVVYLELVGWSERQDESAAQERKDADQARGASGP